MDKQEARAFELVGLSWGPLGPEDDAVFREELQHLFVLGWEELGRARLFRSRCGGVCILRRPSDQSRKWTKEELQHLIREVTLEGCCG